MHRKAEETSNRQQIETDLVRRVEVARRDLLRTKSGAELAKARERLEQALRDLTKYILGR